MKKYLSFIIIFFTLGVCAEETTSKGKTPPPLNLLVISCSLSPSSKSAIAAQEAVKILKTLGYESDFIDLRKYSLPMVDGDDGKAYDDPQVKEIHDRIEKADGILIASPINNNGVASSTKNLMDLTTYTHKTILSGKAWNKKAVGYIGASGKYSFYMFFPFINSLIIKSKIYFSPSFAIVNKEDLTEKNEFVPETLSRLKGVVSDFVSLTTAVKGL